MNNKQLTSLQQLLQPCVLLTSCIRMPRRLTEHTSSSIALLTTGIIPRNPSRLDKHSTIRRGAISAISASKLSFFFLVLRDDCRCQVTPCPWVCPDSKAAALRREEILVFDGGDEESL